LAELIAGSPHNLVARGERPRVDVHIEECVAVGQVLAPGAGTRWLDLGTGGGLPGLVLAVCWPRTEWTLLDSTRKKVEAVRSFIGELELDNARALWGRAEDLGWDPAHRERYDGVVSRAVSRLPVVLELSRGFLREGGLVAAVKGAEAGEEVREAGPASRALGLGDIHTLDVTAAARPTTVVTMRARGPAPRGFPRRTGVPTATPLGGRGR
jgi:16S rRNA (guanine527-N7)-methyltransferase